MTKQELIDALLRVEAGDYRDIEFRAAGLCYNLLKYYAIPVSTWIKLIRRWDEFSGCVAYPVFGEDIYGKTEDKYGHHAEGCKRRRLAGWLARQLQEREDL